jgi:hypothetical protein
MNTGDMLETESSNLQGMHPVVLIYTISFFVPVFDSNCVETQRNFIEYSTFLTMT